MVLAAMMAVALPGAALAVEPEDQHMMLPDIM